MWRNLMNDLEYIQDLVQKSRTALKQVESFDQRQIDTIVRALAKYVYDHAQELAQMAVEETGMGTVEFKTAKNLGKAMIMWHSLKNKKSIGIISDDEQTGIIEIAKPVGVVGAVQPTTNPQVTPMANAMAAIKGRNSIIIAPHPRAEKTTQYLVDRWNELLKELGAPEYLIQYVEGASVAKTTLLLSLSDVTVATGGPGMVKAAYSSGKPSFGVGQGNVQTIIDRDVDMKDAIKMIVDGRVFDRGIICSGEQTIITPVERYDEMRAEIEARGGLWIDDEAAKARLIEVLFPGGVIDKTMVGRDVQGIGKAAGIDVPDDIIVLVVPEDASNKTSLLRKEKMFPVITPFVYNDFSEAIDIAIENLEIEGKGHSVSIHSHNEEHIREFGLRVPVSRVIVNQPCATHNGGNFVNGLQATSTLGCGSWGNNSISENFYYKHLLNITRIAKVQKNPIIPTDEELWAEVE
ncbi:MAG: aldehyde dehydrogenase family protein [Spirochaetia bacterium]|nr:aldehyde dehydrogenase family protein [Spirochaetia bacterium]